MTTPTLREALEELRGYCLMGPLPTPPSLLRKVDAALHAQPELPEPYAHLVKRTVFGKAHDGDGVEAFEWLEEQEQPYEPDAFPVYTDAQLQQAVEQALVTDDQDDEEFNPSEQYAKRDHQALDKAGGYFMRHMSAMTGEGLHSKSRIAGELAWRDSEIDQLNAQAKREPLSKIKAMQVGIQAIDLITPLGRQTTDAAYALTRFYERLHGIGDKA